MSHKSQIANSFLTLECYFKIPNKRNPRLLFWKKKSDPNPLSSPLLLGPPPLPPLINFWIFKSRSKKI